MLDRHVYEFGQYSRLGTYPVSGGSWRHQALGDTNIVLRNTQPKKRLHSQGLLVRYSKELAHDERGRKRCGRIRHISINLEVRA